MPGLREFSQSDFRREAIRGANLVKARRGSCPTVPFCHPLGAAVMARDLTPLTPGRARVYEGREGKRERGEGGKRGRESQVNRRPNRSVFPRLHRDRFTSALRDDTDVVFEMTRDDKLVPAACTDLVLAQETSLPPLNEEYRRTFAVITSSPLSTSSSSPSPTPRPNNMLFRESCSV